MNTWDKLVAMYRKRLRLKRKIQTGGGICFICSRVQQRRTCMQGTPRSFSIQILCQLEMCPSSLARVAFFFWRQSTDFKKKSQNLFSGTYFFNHRARLYSPFNASQISPTRFWDEVLLNLMQMTTTSNMGGDAYREKHPCTTTSLIFLQGENGANQSNHDAGDKKMRGGPRYRQVSANDAHLGANTATPCNLKICVKNPLKTFEHIKRFLREGRKKKSHSSSKRMNPGTCKQHLDPSPRPL